MPNQWETHYDPAICDKIIEMFSDGSSVTKVAAKKLGIARSTYLKWKKDHPEFAAVCEIGENLAEAVLEDKGEAGMQGETENFNATVYKFHMVNRFRATYGEQKEEKSAGDTLLEQLVLGKVKITPNE